MAKKLSVSDLYKAVVTDDNVSYIDYWSELDESLIDAYIKSYDIETKCASECVTCQITHIEKYREKFPDSPRDSIAKYKESGRKGELTHAWQISCPFIPKDNDYLSEMPLAVKLAVAEEEDLEYLKVVNDPVVFAKRYLNWRPRKHQELMLRCQAKRKVLRWGRRCGKSEAFAVEILWHAFTKQTLIPDEETGDLIPRGIKILIVAPFESQVIQIFELLEKFVEGSEELKAAKKAYRKSPHHHLEFANGAVIKGFTTGANEAASIRGQDAHIMFIDEADYLGEGDYKTIMPIAQSHPDVLVRVSSTPKGKRERFYDWCETRANWKEFYFPSAVIDETPYSQSGISWAQMRREMRSEYTSDEWMQEIMAVFIANTQGVYQPRFVADAMRGYEYSDMKDAKMTGGLVGWRYTIGVDWNSNVGTEICVIGLAHNQPFTVVESVNVPKQDFTQHKGLTKLVEMIQFWEPDYVYVDAGAGSTNYEMLKMWSLKQKPGSFGRKVGEFIKKYEFGGKVETRDPMTGKLIKHPAKAFMVENSVRKFEDRTVNFSHNDNKLRKQLLNYIVKSRTQAGQPIYGVESESIGDHLLDAFNLALIAWQMEEGALAKFGPYTNTTVGVIGGATHMTVANMIESQASTGVSALDAVAASRAVSLENRSKKILGNSDNTNGLFEKVSSDGKINDTHHLFLEAKAARNLAKQRKDKGRSKRMVGSRTSRL